MKRVLILGANGFIGSALVRRLVELGHYRVTGMDLSWRNLGPYLEHPAFEFFEGDLRTDRDWVAHAVRNSDVVLPLVAIATPRSYVEEPLRVFELGFEENLRVVRLCAEHGKRVLFPSTSEVYGMCSDDEFSEDSSPLVMGPIHKQRWIYGCLKQLIDRVIWAYGLEEGLRFTIFRPFNWIGPRLDRLEDERIGSSRVVTQFIGSIVSREPIYLVDGGRQKRCFTDLRDGVDALERIIADDTGRSDRQIINVGNPANECSVRELGERLLRIYGEELDGETLPPGEAFRDVASEEFYGPGYEDMVRRKPNIEKARRLLGWEPRVTLDDALRGTLRYFIEELRSRRSGSGGRSRVFDGAS